MRVQKRNGQFEEVIFDKITSRLRHIINQNPSQLQHLDISIIVQEVIGRIYDGIPTTQLDNFTADICTSKAFQDPDYNILAAYITIDSHHKNTDTDFFNVINKLYLNKDVNGDNAALISRKFYKFVKNNRDTLNSILDYTRDFYLTYFGFKTLMRSYLKQVNGEVIERPQHLWLRVAIGIHGEDIKVITETYNLLSNLYFTHATPTLFHAGSTRAQLASCFLLTIEDNLEGIFKIVTDCAKISKWAGGMGVNISNIRAQNSIIRKTGGKSDGIIPMLKVFNETANYINQSGKRPGSIAMYLEPWHADIFKFLNAGKQHGDEKERAKDLFYALWIPDLFMRAVMNDDDWYLMCPDECKGLGNVYGEEFDRLYEFYVKEKKYKKSVKALDVWSGIISAQIETGQPYMLYKDAANKKSNQKNLGTIKSSNLCVAPETRILTSQGYQIISELVDNDVYVWNGYEFSNTTVKKTGNYIHLLSISFSNGCKLRCTEYHKFLINQEFVTADSLDFGAKIDDYMTSDGTLHTNVFVINIEDGGYDDTYCFNEPIRHTGIFNGVLTGNCTEIIQYTDSKETSVCNLSSIGLPKFVDYPDISKFKIGDNIINLIKSNNEIITMLNCEWCILLKGLLRERKIPFSEKVIVKDDFDSLGIKTVPQFYVDSICIGGYTNTKELFLPTINHDHLNKVTQVITRNLNKVIDVTYYPTPEAKHSNLKHRPMGIGIQGLADLYMMFGCSFDSELAKRLNIEIFETIYFAAITASNHLAKIDGPYDSFVGSPMSEGKFQFDLWLENGDIPNLDRYLTDRWDWNELRKRVVGIGVRNSLFLAPMPTASTSQILGNNETFEPYTSNIYKRRVLSGEFLVINRWLIRDLINMELWNDDMRERLMYYRGSVQKIKKIPEHTRNIYRTSFEYKKSSLIELSADRGVFIDQSQSLNIWMENIDYQTLSSVHILGWKKGLKTGSYYIRSKPAMNSQSFTIDPIRARQIQSEEQSEEEGEEDNESCLSCGS